MSTTTTKIQQRRVARDDYPTLGDLQPGDAFRFGPDTGGRSATLGVVPRSGTGDDGYGKGMMGTPMHKDGYVLVMILRANDVGARPSQPSEAQWILTYMYQGEQVEVAEGVELTSYFRMGLEA